MTKLVWGFFAAAIACAGCSNQQAADQVSIDPFYGYWSCTETRTMTFAAPQGMAPASTTAHTFMTVAQANGKLQALAKAEAGAGCALALTEMGTNATFDSADPCMTADGFTLTYTSGSAQVASGLQVGVSFDFSGSVMDPASGSQAAAQGSGNSAFACSRVASPVGNGLGSRGGGGW